MDTRFYTTPTGYLNVEYLLNRAGVRCEGLANLLWPGGLWERIVEEADERGVSPEHLVLRIVRQHFAQRAERGGMYDDDVE